MAQRHLAVLGVVFALLVSACGLIADRPGVDQQKTSAFAPYWYVDERTASVLEVKNLLHVPLTLELTLTDASGKALALDPMTVAPQATARRDLTPDIAVDPGGQPAPGQGAGVARWGDGSRPNSQVGSAVLTAVGPGDADAESFGAWIVIENRSEGLGLVTSFHQAHVVERPTRLDGLWWLPYEESQAYLALQNPSGDAAELQLELYGDGKAVAAQRIKLGARAARLVDIAGLLGSAAAERVGGLRISYGPKSASLGIVARGVLVHEERGFSSPLNLYDSSREAAPGAPSELQAPVAYFGDLGRLVTGAKDRLRPHLLLRNTATTDVALRGSVTGRDARGAAARYDLPAMSLGPERSVAIDLEETRRSAGWSLADGVAGFRLTHDGQPTDIVAELINVSETGSLALYDRMRNQAFHATVEQVAISFNLSPGRRSFLIVKNTSDKPQRPRILLDHASDSGAYDVQLSEIAPQQVEIVDIKRLRDERVPDRLGRLLPGSVEFGGARIFGEAGAVVSSDPTFIISENDDSAITISVSCVVFRFPGLGPPSGGGGSAPSCRPKLFEGQSVMVKDTLASGGQTFEFDFDAGGNLGNGQLSVMSRVKQLLAPDSVLVGPSADVALTVSCDAQCNPGFSCSATNCTDERTGDGSLDNMTARALIDAFISSVNTVKADASGQAIVNGLQSTSDHFNYTWFCD